MRIFLYVTVNNFVESCLRVFVIVTVNNYDNTVGVLLEVNCQTDFIAKNEYFQELTDKLTKCIFENSPKDLGTLLKASCDGQIVGDLVSSCIAKTRENIVVRRFHLIKGFNASTVVVAYAHPLGRKYGALIKLEADKPITGNVSGIVGLGRDLAMHVVAFRPQFLSKQAILDDMIDGEDGSKLNNTYLIQNCLMEQPFVKDPGLSVGKYLEEQGKAHGAKLNVTDYVFYGLGQ